MAFVLSELLLCFLLLLCCLVVSSSSMLIAGVWVNCVTSADVRVTSRSAVSTFNLVVLCRVVIVLMYLSHPIDASQCVLNLSHLIQAQESRKVAMILSSPYLNVSSFNAGSIVCRENIFFDLYLSSSSMVFRKYLLYSFPVGKYFRYLKILRV